jgi:hypothetical protein
MLLKISVQLTSFSRGFRSSFLMICCYCCCCCCFCYCCCCCCCCCCLHFVREAFEANLPCRDGTLLLSAEDGCDQLSISLTVAAARRMQIRTRVSAYCSVADVIDNIQQHSHGLNYVQISILICRMLMDDSKIAWKEARSSC